jgi:cell division protein FtsW
MAEEKNIIENSAPEDDVAVRYDIHPQRESVGESFGSLFRGDKVLWVIIIALMVISLLVVYSSTAKMAYMPNSSSSTTAFLHKQIIMLIGCLGALFFGYICNIKLYRYIAVVMFIAGLTFTIGAYVSGEQTNDAARWFKLGFIRFQPSEILKVGTIMYLALILGIKQEDIRKIRFVPTMAFWRWRQPKQREIFKNGAWSIFFPIIISCGVVAPAHISSAFIIGASSLVMLYIGRARWSEIWRIVGWGATAFALMMMLGLGRSSTADSRFTTFWKLWTQDRTEVLAKDLTDTERSMIAIHNGGIMGRGAGQSAVRVEMTHPESDYAFAFFVEEYGIVLSMILIALYVWVFFRAIEIFDKCPKKFPSMLSLGLAMMITSQALLHIMVTVNISPETGQTLPMISRGGSSLLFTAVSLGMILSVSRQTEEGTHTTE